MCVILLAGCGGEIARIEGLPETRDVSGVDWPRLVDTPAVPTDTLLPERGTSALAMLNETQASVLTRAAQPGPQRVAVAELDGRVARIRQQASTAPQGVDEADMAARAARLSQMRALPTVGVDAATLQARAQRVTAARNQIVGAVDESTLQARAQRVTAARNQTVNAVDESTLQARATRIKTQVQSYGGTIDRDALARRSQRVEIAATSPSTIPSDLSERRLRAVPPRTPAAPLPTPKPKSAIRLPDRDKPVISDSFRKRAEEARKRARERAGAAKSE